MRTIHVRTFPLIVVLPIWNGNMTISDVGAHSVTVAWTEWKEGVDIGDPPLVGYETYTEDVNNNQLVIHDPDILFTTITDLDPDTDYEISVSAVRDGSGGTGPRVPASNVTTLCGSKYSETIIHTLKFDVDQSNTSQFRKLG